MVIRLARTRSVWSNIGRLLGFLTSTGFAAADSNVMGVVLACAEFEGCDNVFGFWHENGREWSGMPPMMNYC